MRRIRWWGIVFVVGVTTVVFTLTQRSQSISEAAAGDEDIATFLQRHWQVPIAPQGTPPATYSPLEASLHPKDCGVCHVQQYQDWQTSIHSRSMGSGIYGQLLNMESDPGTYTICATCHTPLQEQIPFVEQGRGYSHNPAFDAQLQRSGLVCAGCHVRQHQRFGPPRGADLPAPAAATVLPHGGFTASTAFQRAEFCKSCHQFKPDDYALNGKLLENTYEEWRQSVYAEEDVQCQSCHMPDRRHLWRGIHDPDMVKQAMEITIRPDAASYAPGVQMQTVITVTNTGAGHYLPTYVTPKIFVEAHLLDTQGQIIENTAQQAAIGREITLNLAQELYDTRIPPKGSRSFTYAQVIPKTGRKLRVRVVVHPDHFYRRFFAAILQDSSAGTGRAALQEALRQAEASPFTVFEHVLSLGMRSHEN